MNAETWWSSICWIFSIKYCFLLFWFSCYVWFQIMRTGSLKLCPQVCSNYVHSLTLQIFEAFVQILLIVNLSLNQILLAFWLYVRQTWMTHLILAISLWGLFFINPKRLYYSYARSLSLREGRNSFCTGRISRKFCRVLLMFLTGFTSLSVLLLFPLPINFFLFLHGFWFYFI